MPRVTIKKREYKLKDLKAWIYGQMRAQGLKQKDVAQKLGISQQVLSTRLKTKKGGKAGRSDPFSFSDLVILFELLGASDEEILRLLKK